MTKNTEENTLTEHSTVEREQEDAREILCQKTGEYFPIRPVGFQHRLWAATIDSIILLFIVQTIVSFFGVEEQPLSPKFEQAVEDAQMLLITVHELMDIIIDEWLASGAVERWITNSSIAFSIIGVYLIILWKLWDSSPGKMLLSCKIIDAKTAGSPSLKQYIIRYVAYLLDVLLLFIGIFWIIFSRKKQQFLHDRIAGTMVVYTKPLAENHEAKRFVRQTITAIAVVVLFALYISI